MCSSTSLKTEELEASSRINNIRDLYRAISDFKKGYQPRCNIVKDEKGDLFADSHNILVRWRNYFSQLFNVHGVKDVGRQKYTQQTYWYLSQVLLSLSLLSAS